MVRDLAEYKHIHNKNASVAAHSLIVLRSKNSHLFNHKDRTTNTKTETFNEEEEKMKLISLNLLILYINFLF